MSCSCGCSDGTGCGDGPATTPLAIDNLPAQPRLAARIGTFSSFRRTMLEALAVRTDLAQLTTRDPDDPAISLVEQAAAVADILTFYTEQYANEAYLGTATIDTDTTRLVGLIGYRPAPGLSATTTLAITLDDAAAFTIAAGFGVQSVPGPGEQPQDFETIADLDADGRLNALPGRPPQRRVSPVAGASGALVYPPGAAGLRGTVHPGDAVVLVRQGTPGAVSATRVTDVAVERERLRINFAAELQGAGVMAYRSRRAIQLFGFDASDTAPPAATTDSSVPGGVRWSFGEATDFALSAGSVLTLDRVYDDLPVGASLLVHDRTWTGIVTVTDSAHVAAEVRTGSAVGIGHGPGHHLLGHAVSTGQLVKSGVATRLTVHPDLPSFADRRLVTVVELAGELPLAGLDDDQLGTEVWVPGTATTADDGTRAVIVATELSAVSTNPGPAVAPADLPNGRAVVLADAAGHGVSTAVSGAVRLEPSDPDDDAGCFLVVPLAATATDLALLHPASLTLFGNAVAASHGKTVAAEVLGSADATVAFQRFTLAKAPLTRVASATVDGSTPALTVRVDGLGRTIIDELLAAGPRDDVVALRTGVDGATTVQFGDGENGTRPNSGTDNVVATYRHGAGLAGRVKAGVLTNAATRPPGLRSVVNPVPAEGGADPEPADQMRQRAPGTVRVFGRAVSAADYADLLVSEGSVAKAQSAQLWDGHGIVLAVTVAGQDGGSFSQSGLNTLAGADKAAATPYRRVVVGNYVAVPLRIALTVAVQARADTDTVLAEVRAALLAAYAFDKVRLAAHAPLSDVYRVAQPVRGVESVTVTSFGFMRGGWRSWLGWAAFLAAHGDTGDPTPEWLRLLGVRIDHGRIAHAELPTLADGDLSIAATSGTAVFAGGLE